MEQVAAGAEISVGQPAEPLPTSIELALRDVVQDHASVAFAYVPVIQFGDQPRSLVLVVYLSGETAPEKELAVLSPAVKAAVDAALQANRKLKMEPLAILPISLGQPLDGLAQAVLITDTMLHVNDVKSWQAARNPKPLLRRMLDWLMGR